MKSCPWCGHEDEHDNFQYSQVNDVSEYVAVECQNCGARGPAQPTPERAEKAWDKRGQQK